MSKKKLCKRCQQPIPPTNMKNVVYCSEECYSKNNSEEKYKPRYF